MVKKYDSVSSLLQDCKWKDAVWTSVYGGDINDSYALTGADGKRIFLKTNDIKKAGMFEAEAAGIEALAFPGMIRIPEIIGCGTDRGKGISFLALSFVGSTQKKRDYWETFGARLGQLHRADVSFLTADFASPGVYGFVMDNFIGSTPQSNTPNESWIDFYRQSRLEPQIRRAERYFSGKTLKAADWLLSHLDRYITEPEFPSLLHGDLWGGNVLCGDDGDAWLIDPAAYVGHYEADIAMTELFGGFSRGFYEAYGEVCRLDEEYRECRRELYQLYHLLNHLILFGRSYLGFVERILLRYGRE